MYSSMNFVSLVIAFGLMIPMFVILVVGMVMEFDARKRVPSAALWGIGGFFVLGLRLCLSMCFMLWTVVGHPGLEGSPTVFGIVMGVRAFMEMVLEFTGMSLLMVALFSRPGQSPEAKS